MCQERTEALSCRSLKLDVHRLVWQSGVAIFLGNHAAEHGTHRAVGVLDSKVEVHLLAVCYCALRTPYELLVEHVVEVVLLLLCVVERGVALFLEEQA